MPDNLFCLSTYPYTSFRPVFPLVGSVWIALYVIRPATEYA